MRNIHALYYSIISLTIISSCGNKNNNSSVESESSLKEIQTQLVGEINKDIFEETKKYIVSQTKNPSISTDKDGNMFIQDGNEGDENYAIYTINPKDIITGDLNEDKLPDATIKLVISHGGNSAQLSNLILIFSKEQDKHVPFEFISDEEITKIKDQTIYTIKSTYAAEDPQCCPSIKEEIKYQIISDKIVKVE